jgi:hypothetical protein
LIESGSAGAETWLGTISHFSAEEVKSYRAGITDLRSATLEVSTAATGEKLAIVVAHTTAVEESETHIIKYHFSR